MLGIVSLSLAIGRGRFSVVHLAYVVLEIASFLDVYLRFADHASLL